MTHTCRRASSLLSASLFFLFASAAIGRAADAVRKQFDIPSDVVEQSVKRLSEQSGVDVLIPDAIASDVRTNAVKGEYTAKGALDRMLEGTGLVAAEDPVTGALTVKRGTNDPNVAGAPPQQPAASPHPEGADQTVTLNPFEVQANSEVGYAALNSNSITAFNTALDHLPIGADTYNSKQLTVSSTTAGAVPLTATLISTPTSSYYANPNLTSGAINSGSAAAKVLEVVDPTHGAILTGVTGLPISNIQLIPSLIPGLSIPNSATISQAGDILTGSPEFSFNLTSVYQFSSGPLEGFKLGGTASDAWRYADYYYYPTGAAISAQRQLFYMPVQPQFGLILGYQRKFHHVTFSTQLNVFNIFNEYEVVVFPNYVSGWTTPSSLTANFNQQPRSFLLTNTLSF